MAAEAGVHRRTVHRLLRPHGIAPRRPLEVIDVEWLRQRDLVDECASVEMAAEAGVAHSTIMKLLGDHGIPRPRDRHTRPYGRWIESGWCAATRWTVR